MPINNDTKMIKIINTNITFKNGFIVDKKIYCSEKLKAKKITTHNMRKMIPIYAKQKRESTKLSLILLFPRSGKHELHALDFLDLGGLTLQRT